MLRLSESATGLAISMPAWIGLLCFALGVALAVYIARGKAEPGKRFGAVMAALVCLYGGWYFLFAVTKLDETGVVVRGAFGVTARAAWSDVVRHAVEERSAGRGRSSYLVLYLGSGGEVPVKISGLSGEEYARLLAFVKERTK